MAAVLSPIWVGIQQFNTLGQMLSGGQIFTYAAGTTTPQATYTDNTLLTPNANPIILDSTGRYSGEIWWAGGVVNSFKFILKDSSNNVIDTKDNLVGIGDFTAPGTSSPLSFIASGLVPTYVSATSFTVLGDQTSIFTGNVRLKTTNTAGTIYSTVTSSSYSAGSGLTTVTIVNDAGTLDSGLSAVSYGYQNNYVTWAVAAGTADAITAAYKPANPSLYDGMELSFRALLPNATTTPTFSPDGLTPHTMTQNGGKALGIGQIAGALAEYKVRYNLANTRWELVNNGPSFKIINTTFDMSSASGTKIVVTGAGQRPRRVRMAQAFSANSAGASIGASDGVTEWCNYSNTAVTAGNTINAAVLGLNLQGAGVTQQFSIVTSGSLDADGCTINNVKAGSPTGTANISLEFDR